jgi:hypothetical protein
MGSNPVVAFPSITQAFVDLQTGQVTLPWYRVLLTIFNRTGGVSGETSALPSTTNNLVGATLSGAALNSAVLLRTGPVAPFVDTTSTATAYLSAHNFPTAPSTNIVLWINQTSVTWIITPGQGVIFMGNLSGGNFTLAANTQRTMVVEINSVSVPSITIYG